MPKSFLLTNKRYDLYNLNIPKLWINRFKNENGFCGNSPKTGANCEESKSIDNDYQTQRPYFKDNGLDNERKTEQYSDEEQPVNLSTKKVDLFNLTQLAEVSIASAAGSINYKPSLSDSSESSSPSSSLPEERQSNLPKTCSDCGKTFTTLSNLSRHKQTHLDIGSESVKKCPHCEKVYVSIPAYSMHLRTHNQGCKCQYCGKGFSRPWLLQGHIRTHTGEKPFQCQICGKSFADKSNLRAHTQTHSSSKPFHCSRCEKTFALKSYLCKHVESSCMVKNSGKG